MTELARLIQRQIEATGPISVAEYMTLALTHPEHGYYSIRDPLGSDFTTAPEISQMFGELMGLALATAWIEQGAPATAALVELGPGKGTLMADALRATARVPGFHDAAAVHLVEVSATLRAVQATALQGHKPSWHDNVSTLPEAPLFVIANEFFDALPVRQFVRSGETWHERVIGLNEGKLDFGLTDAAPLAALDHRLDDTAPGDVVTLCPAAEVVMETLAHAIATHGGLALIVDYGGWQLREDSFQAIHNGAPSPPLARPGEADLTAHVDFERLASFASAQGARVAGPVPQGAYLEALGISLRADALEKAADDVESIRSAHRRLTHPDEMGDLFKVIAVTATDAPPVPGFPS